MLTRKQNWPTLLHNFVRGRAGKPFAWGANDCSTFVADAVLSHTGVDLAADFRGKYSDEAGAAVAIAAVTGGKTVEDAAAYAAKKYGLAELKSPLYAQRGDMVLFDSAHGSALGVVHLNGREAVFVGPAGLRRMRVSACRRAWRIG